jgi:hypothetical protein
VRETFQVVSLDGTDAKDPRIHVPKWIKILIAALSSLSVGILLEPVRALIQNGIAKNRTLGFVADEINGLALSMKDGLLGLRMKQVLIDRKFSNLSRLAREYAPIDSKW